VSEGKKGRVICSWCGKDMGEAETELDTHGCCLGCLKLALREVDERLAAVGHGLAAGGRARERGMALEGEVAEFWQEALSQSGRGVVGLDGALGAVTTPRFEEVPALSLTRLAWDWRWYVPEILREHWGELSLETRLGLLVLAQDWAASETST